MANISFRQNTVEVYLIYTVAGETSSYYATLQNSSITYPTRASLDAISYQAFSLVGDVVAGGIAQASKEKQLADAVFRGDTDAAYILADLILEEMNPPKEWVSRHMLEEQNKSYKEKNEALERVVSDLEAEMKKADRTIDALQTQVKHLSRDG